MVAASSMERKLEAMFDYKPLDSVRNEIRLLELRSLERSRSSFTSSSDSSVADHDVRIVCNLIHAFEDDKPNYQALSYTWGPTNDTETILLNGVPIPVTRNLADALKHIRADSVDITLWVDAICINRKDDHEKGRQVSRMGHIYGNSSNTIVWLGASDEETYEILAE
jgi:hypothetical protein